jgi:hypothetical protein
MFLNIKNNRREPIYSDIEDKMNRSHFVNYVSDIVKNAPVSDKSFVISINGKWGEGKSSAKNLIMEKLLYDKEASDSFLLEFNCFKFQNQAELSKIFLGKIIHVVRGKNRKGQLMDVLKNNKKFTFSVAFILLLLVGFLYPNIMVRFSSILLSFIFIFKTQFKKVTLSSILDVASKAYIKIEVVHRILYYDELKDKDIENVKMIKYLEDKCPYKKIIVFIDNFDLLEPQQIKILIQLVNSNVNLPKFVFVLFYDKFIVESCLTTSFYGGAEFIEKFVNIQLNLPPITENILFMFLQRELQNKYELNIEFMEKFKYVKNYFPSLGKIHSFLNNFSVNYSLVFGNLEYNNSYFLNKKDFLFLEILRFF